MRMETEKVRDYLKRADLYTYMAVSYTHLDVYKRQINNSSSCSRREFVSNK